MNPQPAQFLEICEQTLRLVRRLRIRHAEVYHVWSRDTEVRVRDGKPESVKEATGSGIGLRVFSNRRLGFASTSDFSASGLRMLVEEAASSARVTDPDPHQGLPDACTLPVRRLHLYDNAAAELTTEFRLQQALAMEAAARDHDRRIHGIQNAEWADGETVISLVNTAGFSGQFRTTGFSLSCSPVAKHRGKLQSDYWYTYTRYLRDMESPVHVGVRAAERTVRMLGAKPVPSGKFPVIFDQRAAAGFWGSVLGAFNGESVLRRRSFLCESHGKQIASKMVTLTDDGLLHKGLGSRPFDGEGVPTRKKVLIRAGALRQFLYNSYTARRAGTASTGNAVRGYQSTPGIGCLNLYVQPGGFTPDAIIQSVSRGLLVTGMMGQGVNLVTGDFSRGAEGFWIENGRIQHPVQEVTIAGNFRDLLPGIDMLGNDLEFRSAIACPTFRIREMTVSGT